MNEILTVFDYDNLLIKEYNNWYLLLRKEQVTIGSLVLIEKHFKRKYSDIPQESFVEFGEIVKDIERSLQDLFAYDKINYLMLMMVDKEVHYHIVPRYSGIVSFDNVNFVDKGWPKLVDFSSPNEISETTKLKLKDMLIAKINEKNGPK